MKLYVGTSGYSYPKWKGSFYPRKLPAQQMLPFYSEHFRTVEINYTFRRLPTESVLPPPCGVGAILIGTVLYPRIVPKDAASAAKLKKRTLT